MFLAVATTSFSFSLIFSKLPVARTRNTMTMKTIKMTEVHLYKLWRVIHFRWINIGNSMICSDVWHKYHERYFKIVIRVRQFWNITSVIYNAKYRVQLILLFVYTTTRKRFVIFTCRFSKLSWNNTALSHSNCRNFSCSSMNIATRRHWLYLSRTTYLSSQKSKNQASTWKQRLPCVLCKVQFTACLP